MTFEELGDLFRRERERRGLSVETVAGRLKLMPRVVRAIEQGDAEVLPQAAYARGFVKAYGSLLEIEAEQVAAGIEDVWPNDFSGPSPAPYEAEEEKRGMGKGVSALLLGLVPVLLAFGAFWHFRDLDVNHTRSVNTAVPAMPGQSVSVAEQAKRAPVESAKAQAAGRADPATGPQAPSASGTTPLMSAPPAPPTHASTQTETRAAQPADQSQRPTSSAATQAAAHQIIIIALAECWVHSNADETDTRQFSLRKGDTFVLPFNKQLLLKLGNAGGVRIRFDGRDMPPPGESGQVKTLTFPPAP